MGLDREATFRIHSPWATCIISNHKLAEAGGHLQAGNPSFGRPARALDIGNRARARLNDRYLRNTPARRTLLKVVLPPEERARTAELMEALMGRRPELRFRFIQENAASLDAEAVDA